jgi:hypothetical protein
MSWTVTDVCGVVAQLKVGTTSSLGAAAVLNFGELQD